MKKYILFPMLITAAVMIFMSCSDDELDSQSVITADRVEYTPFDRWLQVNYLAPYNIDFKWRYEDKESDMDFYTVPADTLQAIKLAHLVKYLCLEAYDEVGGIEFTRANFPKMIFTIGEWEYQNNGTFILGTAEGGRKILLTGVNDLDKHINNIEELNYYYFKTIHHEFTHILNQTKDYPADFKLITGSGYVADKWSDSPANRNYLQRGFISSYSQHSDTEDFAEMLSMYICYSEKQWNAWMEEAGGEGSTKLGAKLDIVRDYMSTSWGIDINALRSTIQRRQAEVAAGRIDLTDISVNN